MSRIGKQPIPVPAGVTIKADADGRVTVTGPKGTLTRDLSPEMMIKQEDGVITVDRPTDSDRHRAFHGLTRTLVANMVTGVSTGLPEDAERYRRRFPRHGCRRQLDAERRLFALGRTDSAPGHHVFVRRRSRNAYAHCHGCWN